MRALLVQLLQGHASAVELCLLVFGWMNDYDHLVDKDTPEDQTEGTLHSMAWAMTVEMPTNSFYRAYQGELTVTLANAISTWRASTALQRSGSKHDLEVAHVLRWVPIEFFMHCARIVGGRKWADEQAPIFWRAMTVDHPLEQFLQENGGA